MPTPPASAVTPCPAGSGLLGRKLGLDISGLSTWEDYTRRIVMMDDRDGFLDRVRRLD